MTKWTLRKDFLLTLLSAMMIGAGGWLIFESGIIGTTPDDVVTPQAQVNPAPSSPPPVAQQPSRDLRDRVNWEEQRLSRLRAAVNEIDRGLASIETVKTQLASIRGGMQDVQKRVSALNVEKMEIDQEARALHQEETVDRNTTSLALESQIQALDTQILEAKNRLQNALNKPAAPRVYDMQVDLAKQGTPPPNAEVEGLQNQVTQLEVQKTQLAGRLSATARIAENNTIEISQQAVAAKDEVRTERQSLLRELNDLSSSLKYWEKQEQAVAQDEDLRRNRLDELKQQYSDQERRVAKLRVELAKYQ